ncbi:hypothetical protein JOE44_001952 [Chryseobacterium sp. PvR013]|uniref:hypothetical protein n=1 Tax=Chryseobacterium sp. PvR013 TaxID=2806595 RepID=UPI001AE15D4E|nr:hypothetical protein [Chryseobacterium sp. PvR013]MBP1165068.1 hypothetical protein [Chryseobacterium sp. PvR013]
MENLGKSASDAAKAFTAFHKELYKGLSIDYNELKKVCKSLDLEENEDYFFKTPDEYNKEFINLVTVGCTLKQAYELLKETYNF